MYDLDEDFHDLLQIGSDNTLSSHRSWNTNKHDSDSKLRRNQKKSSTKYFTESYKETYKNHNGAESRVIKEENNSNGKKKSVKKIYRTDKKGHVLQDETIVNGKHLQADENKPI